MRDMRMTRTEYKREHKDTEGDPLILSARKQRRYEDQTMPPLGVKSASFMVVGNDEIVGISYDKKKMPIPYIVIKARGAAVQAVFDSADKRYIPIVSLPDLARTLAETQRPGEYVKAEHFPLIAQILLQLKLY
ncbi:MAG: EscU/YscU/HrcU family type III secretion system export apparatus switch protein [Alphaproteobacteria bacterium]